MPTGTLPCAESHCANQTAVACAYRDRRGRNCAIAFCPQHWTLVGGVVYCRRHAGTIAALGSAAATNGSLPELGNRGPSLVNWVAGAIDDGVVGLLERVARVGETVKTETAVTVIFDAKRRRRWERSWKLIENTGINLKVAVEVAADADDALIDARVGSCVVARGVPPWIARRRAGVDVSAQVDEEQRRLFSQFFLDNIATEVAQQRAEDFADRRA